MRWIPHPGRRIVLPVVFGILLVASWEAFYQTCSVSKLILAGPSAIAMAGLANASELLHHAVITITEALAGFMIGNLSGLAVASAFMSWPLLKRTVFPMAILFQAIPVVAVLPVLIIWLGNGMGPKIFIAAFLSFFPMLINAYRGLSNVDAEILELLHSYSAEPRQTLRVVRLPAALPFMFTALKLSACGSMVAALVADWVASQQGLGHLIVYYSVGYRIPNVWSAALLACFVSLVFYGFVSQCEKWTLRRLGSAP